MSPSTPKHVLIEQPNQAQAYITEEEYLSLIRNGEIAQNQALASQTADYAAAPPASTAYSTLAGQNKYQQVQYDKSPGVNEYKKPTVRQQAYVRPNTLQTSRQGAYHGGPYVDYATEREIQRSASSKKYVDTGSKGKLDPSRGQYHQETKPQKYLNFKPSYQLPATNQPQTASQFQPIIHIQPQPQPQPQLQPQTPKPAPKFHYQQVSEQQQTRHFQSTLPQVQQYYQDSNGAHNSHLPQPERLVANQYAPQAEYDTDAGSNKQSTAQPEFHIQYLNPQKQKSPNRYLPEPTEQISQRQENTVPKYEYYDAQEEQPKAPKTQSVKIIQSAPVQYERPQYIEQPQYHTKKIKVSAAVPQQHQQQILIQPQIQVQPQLQSQGQQQPHIQYQPEALQQVVPSRSTIFVSQNLAPQNENTPEKSQIPIGHQTISDPLQRPGPRIPLTNPKKPITQAEFQALLDAGYKVTAVPVPVPVPVSPEKYKQLQMQQRQLYHQQQLRHPQAHHPQPQLQYQLQPMHQPNLDSANRHNVHAQQAQQYAQHARQPASSNHYVRYQPQAQEPANDDNIFASYLRPFIDYIGNPSKPNS